MSDLASNLFIQTSLALGFGFIGFLFGLQFNEPSEDQHLERMRLCEGDYIANGEAWRCVLPKPKIPLNERIRRMR